MEYFVTIFLGIIGGSEVILILIVVLILFGGRKIPELMRGLGNGIREFKKASSDNDALKDIKNIKKEVDSVADEIKNSTKL